MGRRLSEDLRNTIVTLHTRGFSQRRIARDLGVSRNTVRDVLKQIEMQRSRGHTALPDLPKRRGSKLDPYDDFIKQQLEKYPDLSAVRMLEELRAEGFDGGYTIVKERLRELRPTPKQTPVTTFETEPGQQGQQDWSPYTLDFTEAGRQKVNTFSLLLGYSRRQYVSFTENEGFYPLIREHVKAFEYFGGVPREIVYDGQKAVAVGWEGNQPIYNPRFLAFATYYGFRPRAFKGKPEWKGKVERPFQYVEGNALSGREFRDLAHLNEFIGWWLRNRADVRTHGTLRERPIDRFVTEAPQLLPLPARPYDTAEVGYRVVRSTGYVEVETVYYSVPYAHLLELVVVRLTENEVFVYGPDLAEIARHERAPRERVEPVEDPAHHPKKRPRYDTEALAARLSELGDVGATFAAGVVRRQRYHGRHLARVLELVERYAVDDLLAALERAVRYRAFDAKHVERILATQATPRVLPDLHERGAIERLANLVRAPEPRAMADYAAALQGDD